MNYIFLVSETTSKNNLWLYRDIEKEEDVVFKCPWGSGNLFSKCLRFLLSKIGRLFRRDLIKRINSNPIKIKPDQQYCFIVETGYLMTCEPNFFETIKKNKNVIVFLMLVDAMKASSPSLAAMKDQVLNNKWDAVFTFEKADAEEYGWFYSGINYSSLPRSRNRKNVYDAYFVGGLKGERNELIISSYKLFAENNISCRYDLWYPNKKALADFNELKKRCKAIKNSGNKSCIVFHKHWMKYRKVRKLVESSNCVVELVQKGQKNQTMRWFEAVFYGKKLLTNNCNIKSLPYYDGRFMRCFSSAEEIDLEWLKNRDDVNYDYHNDFSPSDLLRKIKEKSKELMR